MSKMCKNCGTITTDDNCNNCTNCGAVLQPNENQAQMNGMQQPYQQQQYQQQYQQPYYGQQMQQVNPNAKSKMAAGLLGIFLGGWGVHNFYLGNTGRAVAQIIVTIVTCGIGSIWGLIEGIMILTGSINTDANGVPLKD